MATGITTTTGTPAYQFNSNADITTRYVNLPKLYAVPPGMQLGVWHELIIHAHWATDSSGKIDAWHRVKGQSGWTNTASLSGYPTLQDNPDGSYPGTTIDMIGAIGCAQSRRPRSGSTGSADPAPSQPLPRTFPDRRFAATESPTTRNGPPADTGGPFPLFGLSSPGGSRAPCEGRPEHPGQWPDSAGIGPLARGRSGTPPAARPAEASATHVQSFGIRLTPASSRRWTLKLKSVVAAPRARRERRSNGRDTRASRAATIPADRSGEYRTTPRRCPNGGRRRCLSSSARPAHGSGARDRDPPRRGSSEGRNRRACRTLPPDEEQSRRCPRLGGRASRAGRPLELSG